MAAYYNEIDPNAAEWLRQLIKMGAITDGEVDERSIEDVKPSDVAGFQRVHFFAGIGGWEYALKLAEWPIDRPVWTGSCPCQPFSSAGKGGGFNDERHLWPSLFWLIQQCCPKTILGEQVASKDGLQWWDLVQSDLEGAHYAAAAVDLCAAGVGAPHIRQRLFWVAYSNGRGQYRLRTESRYSDGVARSSEREDQKNSPLAYSDQPRRKTQRPCKIRARAINETCLLGSDGTLAHSSSKGLPISECNRGTPSETSGTGQRKAIERTSAYANPWSTPIWLPCADGKERPAQRSIFPLAYGLSKGMVRSSDPSTPDIETEATTEARVMRLKGYGNAIVPQVAAEFIKAVC